jgi:hypothetical protein
MSQRPELPTSTDDLLRQVAMTDRARHLVALYLEATRESVDADPAGAAARALRRLPQQGPLRRQKDRDVLKAIRIIVNELDSSEALRKQLRWVLEEAEWRARLGAK